MSAFSAFVLSSRVPPGKWFSGEQGMGRERHTALRPALACALGAFALWAAPALAQTNAPAADGPFAKFSAGDLIKLLDDADKERAAQAAQALGDRAIAGKMKLSEEEAKALHAFVTATIRKARSPADMKEADRQIQRLWHLAAPALLDGLDNLETYSFSARSLSIIKNEAVAKALAEKAKNTSDGARKGLMKFALQAMKDLRAPSVPGRSAVSSAESDRITREIIVPTLEELQ